ncbi:MAG TPA: hypothetical protein VMF31_07085 [Solirubrobacterales bacterium]|nr:hypothetical protein [Solirubrobacterales bacterium]
MIKNLPKWALLALFLALPAGLPSFATAATPKLQPRPIKCHQLQGSGPKVCSEKPGRIPWKNGWWADATKYKVIDANLYTETEWDIPSDGYKAFYGAGHVIVNARKGFGGTLKFPPKKRGVSVTVLSGSPVKSSAASAGGWVTDDGPFGCGVDEELGAGYAPSSLAGVVAANPKSKEISIQWAMPAAPFRCPSGVPVSNPTGIELPSSAVTTRYPVSAFRKGDLFRLPIRASWTHTDPGDNGVFTFSLVGSIVIERVHHRIR